MENVVKISAPRCSQCQSTNVARLLKENGRLVCLDCHHSSPEETSTRERSGVFCAGACHFPNQVVEYVYF